MASTTAPGMRRRLAWGAFVLALLVQLAVLYAPSAPSATPGIPGLDKLIHAGIFLLPALLGMLAGIRPAWLGAALAVHAVASEVAQHLLLPERSGDVADAVANLVGVGLGLVLGAVLRAATRHRAARAAR